MTDAQDNADPQASQTPLDWRQSARKRFKVAAAATGGKLLVRLLGATLRLHAQSVELAVARHGRSTGLIFALFHGAHFPTLRPYGRPEMCVIASRSADGEILARIMASFGVTLVRGSSSRGGMRALVDLARHVKAGKDATIAVDGPRGPRHRVKPGVILLAKLTGAGIIPCAASLSRYWQLNSWDRYRIPKPWSRALVVLDEPLTVPRDADDVLCEAKRIELEQRLVALQQQADEAVMTDAAARSMLAEHDR